jgi:Etoposide-induced protein 2.4 (EI24)
LSYLA